MYRILIVDDEPPIVNGLYEMLRDVFDEEADLYRAYTSQEALQWLTRTKIDIVLTDIRMPGMDGLELQRRIREQWPRCKIIFLTGFDQFDYVQTAMRHGGVDYILKTEGDEKIVASIRSAMDSLDKEYTQEQILLRSRHQLQSAIPLLQRQFLQSLLADDEACARLTQAKLDELQLPLLLEHPLLLVVCRVDEWPNPLSLSDKELLRYAVNNIADESLVLARLAQTSIGDNRFVWFLQPAALQDKSPAAARNPEEPGLSDADRELWQKMIRFVHGTLETVQQTCRNLLRLPLSIIAGQAPVAWTQLGKQYQSLSRILDIGPGNGREMLLIEPAGAPAAHRSAPPAYHLQWLSALESYLEHGQKQPFLDEFQRTSEAILSSGTERRYFLEFYYKVVSMLLAYLNRMDMPDVLEKLDLDRLLHFSRYSSDEEALRHLRDAIESVVEGRQFAQDARTHQVVRELQEFIAEHLSEDLSLTVLAEKVHHHPFYLSRLYKQCTGVSLSDYIASLRIEKAKSLLKETHMKIYEVGKAVGFESAGYFIRFFKKHTGMTPNEYKEGVLRKK